jgi:ATP-dependent DNA ligase
MSVLQILESIGSDSKRTHKISVINQNRGNDLFMKVAKLALDPYTQFYIRKIPDYVPMHIGVQKTLDWALVELEKLSERLVTGNDGIEHLRSILSSIHPDDATVITRIIGKDLRCGASDGTFNDAITGFIPTYPCLLARPYDEKNIKNIKYPAYSQLKADGLRANAIVNGHKVQLCGRSGREIDLLGALDVGMQRLACHFPWPVVFDGEFVVVDKNEKVIDRKTGNGIINKAIKGTISLEEARQVRFQIWDAIPLHEFRKGASSESYRTRFERLISAVSNGGTPNWKPYWVIPYEVVNSLDEAVKHFELLLSQGHEGTILKNYSAIWEDSRSKHLVKMKAEKDCDLEIIGYNPGEGKFVGQVGSLICSSSDRKVEVAISGFSDELRKWISDNMNDLMGKIVTVTYNERIKSRDRTDVDSLFLPRFQEFRSDKTVANTDKEIK